MNQRRTYPLGWPVADRPGGWLPLARVGRRVLLVVAEAADVARAVAAVLRRVARKVAGAGVEAPIIVLSISPPPISKSSITTFPPLLPESKRLEFDSSVEILLSLICIPSTSSWPITVCVPVMPTFPVVVMPIVAAPEVISIPPLPHYTTLHHNTLYYTTLHHTTLHYTNELSLSLIHHCT